MKEFDLLNTAESGGCSAKLPAKELSRALSDLPSTPHPKLLVGIDTYDDAGAFKINDELAIIQTTDFFTPVCSDPYEFGQIAAANALSDIYAMGGKVLTALNIAAFPPELDLKILHETLRGGIEKLKEAGGVMLGGHTIVDKIPKYGMAVTGTVHPDRIITNAAAKPGEILILTKALGSGIIMSGHKIGEISEQDYRIVLESMKQLNAEGAAIMQKYNVKCATDITGFGLAGHALKLAKASGVSLEIEAEKIPVFDGVMKLIDMACIPGACFRNLEYTENEIKYDKTLNYNHKIITLDAQTSGGLLMCCKEDTAEQVVNELKQFYTQTAVIGKVKNVEENRVSFVYKRRQNNPNNTTK
ncbi:MAG TPA: selenide, water dikinase SelD [Ignavibacteria bacterium]|nr:selenide, water dikinase SelD [Ignavibacteria bacterium]